MSATMTPMLPVAVSSPPPAQALLASIATFRQTTVSEYEHLTKIGVLTPEDRVELLDGYMVNKMSHNDPHRSTVLRLTEDLVRAAPRGWCISIQLPIELARSVPEPDGAVVRGNRRTFDHRKPGSADVGVVVQVTDTSLVLDRREKGRLYAEAGLPVYWLVNLIDNII